MIDSCGTVHVLRKYLGDKDATRLTYIDKTSFNDLFPKHIGDESKQKLTLGQHPQLIKFIFGLFYIVFVFSKSYYR